MTQEEKKRLLRLPYDQKLEVLNKLRDRMNPMSIGILEAVNGSASTKYGLSDNDKRWVDRMINALEKK